MQFWCCAKFPFGSSCQSDDDGSRATREYHGRQAYGERAAIWYVPEFGQSNGGGCDGCGNGCSDANAVYSEYTGAMDRWSSNGVIGEYAGAQQQLEADVYVGGRNSNIVRGAGDGSGAVRVGESQSLENTVQT